MTTGTATREDPPTGAVDRNASTVGEREFRIIRELVYERFGINLTEQKRALVAGRLQKLVREQGFESVGAYCRHLLSDRSGRALDALVSHVTTNYTFFAREIAHFDFFRRQGLPDIVASLKRRDSRDLRVWCAACSTGQEAYTLMMLTRDFFGNEYGTWDAGLLATDISSRALLVARAGVYKQEDVKRLSPELKQAYFRRLSDGRWAVRDRLKREITFRRFNLTNPSYPFKKPFQAIFCRNVMIYFDRTTRDRVAENLSRFTEPGGYLFLGHSETLDTGQHGFRRVIPAVYRKERA